MSTETEEDLYDSSDNDVKYEETNTDEIHERINNVSNKRVRGFWTVTGDRYTLYKRTLNDRFTDATEWIIAYFKKSIDFSIIFIYNVYCKHKHHERIKTVKKQDSTQSTENTKSKNKLPHRGWYLNPWNWNWHAIMGLGRLLAIASMIFSAFVIYMGTSGEIFPKVWIAPMAIYALYILAKQFTASSKGDK